MTGAGLRLSVLIVVRDEAGPLAALLDSLSRQTLPPAAFELIIVDGGSGDASRRVAEEAARRFSAGGGPPVSILDNPRRTLAPGWNLGIRAARAPVVLRLDAHARIPPGFLAASLDALGQRPDAWAAGGRIRTVGETYWGRVNAIVLSHPFGVGGSPFRTSRGTPGEGRGRWVDTVPYAAYHRWVFERVGLFDERLRRGEDLELHARIRRAGGRFWLDDAVESEYVARPTLGGLLKKAWGDGFWNPRALALSGGAMRPRHYAPPLFVLLAATLGALAVAGRGLPLAAFAGLYLAAALAAAVDGAWRTGELSRAPGAWLASALFHLTRGLAALAGIGSLPFWTPGRNSSASG